MRRVDRADLRADTAVAAFILIYAELSLRADYYRLEGAFHVAGAAAYAFFPIYFMSHG